MLDPTPSRPATPRAQLQALLALRLGPSAGPPITDLDWPAVAQLAAASDVEALVYATASAAGLKPPGAIEAHLESRYFQNIACNAWQFHALKLALLRLDAASIPAVLLKGAALTEVVYCDRAVRTLGDLDLLVRREQAAAAMRSLEDLGYAIIAGANLELTLTADNQHFDPEAIAVFDSQVTLQRTEAPHTIIDLHWSLIDRPIYHHRLDMAWFWSTARPLVVDGAPGLVLGSEAQLLHLCTHVALHHPEHAGLDIRWRHDIAEVIVHDRAALDWDLLIGQAAACDLVIPLQRVLAEPPACNYVPPGVLDRLAALVPTVFERRAFARISAGRPSSVGHLWANVQALPGWRPRTRYLCAKILPSPAYMRYRYPIPHPLFLPLAYPYRWLRGLAAWVASRRHG